MRNGKTDVVLTGAGIKLDNSETPSVISVFAAPEIVLGLVVNDKRSDLWSIGVIAYML